MMMVDYPLYTPNLSASHTHCAISCALCSLIFATVQEQRSHVRSDLHGYNLKQKIRGQRAVTETDFERLIANLDDSISGSDSDDDGVGFAFR